MSWIPSNFIIIHPQTTKKRDVTITSLKLTRTLYRPRKVHSYGNGGITHTKEEIKMFLSSPQKKEERSEPIEKIRSSAPSVTVSSFLPLLPFANAFYDQL